MLVLANSLTTVDSESVEIIGDKYHIIITETNAGKVEIKSVDGDFWFWTLNPNSVVMEVEPHQEQS